MTRIKKQNLPHNIKVKPIWVVVAWFSILFTVSYLYASRSGSIDAETAEYVGDFYQTRPEPGVLSPITWREDGSHVSPNAYRILIPNQLTSAMKDFVDSIGLTELSRSFIMSEESNIEPDGYRFFDLGGIKWFAQRPASKWQSDMHWISPADESGHEAYIKLLRENGFLSVLNSIGEQLDLDGLTAYHLTFIVVSHCEQGFIHHDTKDTGNKVFNVIIPLESPTNSPPELIITDSRDDSVGRLKYENNIGVMIGDEVYHATSECDYRNNPGAMRLAATVYIADINEDNAENIAFKTLTQAFPPPDEDWVLSQRARHWINAKNLDADMSKGVENFVGDRGRTNFEAGDLNENCAADVDCDNWDVRKACASTCNIFVDKKFYDGFSGPDLLVH